MDDDDPEGYAQLWLSELGAHVPEQHDGKAAPPHLYLFGMRLSEEERARRHGARLDRERGAGRA